MVGKKKVTADLLVFFQIQMFQKFTKGVCMIRCRISLKINFLDIRSILSPLLFNTNLCDLFLSEYSSECPYFADTTPYECGVNSL